MKGECECREQPPRGRMRFRSRRAHVPAATSTLATILTPGALMARPREEVHSWPPRQKTSRPGPE